jgi:hypothetical protein
MFSPLSPNNPSHISPGPNIYRDSVTPDLPQFLQTSERTASRLHHDRFLPNPFQFIIHPSFYPLSGATVYGSWNFYFMHKFELTEITWNIVLDRGFHLTSSFFYQGKFSRRKPSRNWNQDSRKHSVQIPLAKSSKWLLATQLWVWPSHV